MKLTTLSFVSVLVYRDPSSIQRLIPVRFLLLSAVFCLFTHCSEILSVPNISHERVEILSPSDEATVDELPVTLSWIGVQDASHYRIQIFTPSIEKSERILIDSILTNEFYTDSLLIGELEWRVRAENSSYQSPYSSRKLNVVIPSITTDKIVLLAPVEGVVQSDFETFFSWNSLPNAVNYRIQIGKPNFDELEELVLDSIITNSSLAYKFEDAGRYQWRVRGENQEKFSSYTTRNFVLEADTSLENETIVLLAPINDVNFNGNTIRFTWEENKNATHYRIQVSTPDFENTEQYILDSLITSTNMSHVFETGKAYQWRVRGENKEVYSPFTTRNFTVGDHTPIENETIILLAPSNNLTLTNSSIRFTWEAIEKADNYRIQVSTPNFENPEQFIIDTITDATNLDHTFEDGKTYQWRVKAMNEFAETSYSSRTFQIQTTPDLTNQTVQVLAPINNSKLSNTNVNLTWEAVEGATEYHVQIATPSFANALQIVADSRISITTFNQTLTASTTYEWRVRAENENSETGYTTSKFSVQ